MIKAGRDRSTRMSHWVLILAVALASIDYATNVLAQYIAIGPPSFQSNSFPSLETLILDRLAVGGQYNPGDLGTLSHLTVLESIAMLADIQTDMPYSVTGVRLEGEIRQLWDAAAVFEESVSATSIDMKTLTRVQPLYDDLQGAYAQVESTLAGAAGLSSRAAAHLRGITSLTAASGTLMQAIEFDLLAAVPPPGKSTADLESLHKGARLLANHIVALVANVKASKHQTSGWSVVTKDLQELFALVQSFERTLSEEQPSTQTIEVSLHAVRRRMWRVEARIAQLGWPTDLARQWRCQGATWRDLGRAGPASSHRSRARRTGRSTSGPGSSKEISDPHLPRSALNCGRVPLKSTYQSLGVVREETIDIN